LHELSSHLSTTNAQTNNSPHRFKPENSHRFRRIPLAFCISIQEIIHTVAMDSPKSDTDSSTEKPCYFFYLRMIEGFRNRSRNLKGVDQSKGREETLIEIE
jgi:hypothetical protein